MALVDDDRLRRHRATARAGPRRGPAGRPVAEEDDPRALGLRLHGDGVDRGRLQLGQVDVAAGSAARSRSPASAATARQVRRRHERLDTLDGGRAGREERRRARPSGAARAAPAAAEKGSDPAGGAAAPSAASTSCGPSGAVLGERLRRAGAQHAHRAVNLDGRDAGARALEDERAGVERGGERGTGGHVRLGRRACKAAAHTPAADRAHSREDGVLEVVGGGVAASLGGDREQLVEAEAGLREPRLGRAAAAHADDHRRRRPARAEAPPSARPRPSCRCACRCRSRRASGRRTAAARSGAARAAAPAPRSAGRARARAPRAAAWPTRAAPARRRGRSPRRRAARAAAAPPPGSVSTGRP